MTKEEQVKKQAIKRILVKEAIEESTIYKKIMRAIKEFPGIYVNIDDLVDSYMELSTVNNIETKNDFFTVDGEIVKKVLLGTTAELSRDENGIVFKDNGDIDTEASIEQQMMMEYGTGVIVNLGDYAEKKDIIDQIYQTIQVSEQEDFEYSFTINEYIAAEITYFENLTVAEQKDDIKQEAVEVADNKRVSTFFNKKEDFLAMETMNEIAHAVQSGKKVKGKFKKAVEKNSMLRGMLDSNGELKIDEIVKIVEAYRDAYAIKEASKYIEQIADSELTFSDLKPDEQKQYLQEAYILFSGSTKEDRKLAIKALQTISPDLVQRSQGVRGRPYEINEEQFVDLYSKITGQEMSIGDIKHEVHEHKVDITDKRMKHLHKKVKNGTFEERASVEGEDEKSKSNVIKKITENGREEEKRQISSKPIYRKFKTIADGMLQTAKPIEITQMMVNMYITSKRKDDIVTQAFAEQYMRDNPEMFGKFIAENGRIHIVNEKIKPVNLEMERRLTEILAMAKRDYENGDKITQKLISVVAKPKDYLMDLINSKLNETNKNNYGLPQPLDAQQVFNDATKLNINAVTHIAINNMLNKEEMYQVQPVSIYKDEDGIHTVQEPRPVWEISEEKRREINLGIFQASQNAQNMRNNNGKAVPGNAGKKVSKGVEH